MAKPIKSLLDDLSNTSKLINLNSVNPSQPNLILLKSLKRKKDSIKRDIGYRLDLNLTKATYTINNRLFESLFVNMSEDDIIQIINFIKNTGIDIKLQSINKIQIKGLNMDLSKDPIRVFFKHPRI